MKPTLKLAFQNDLERITWTHKFSPETLNIKSGDWPEVEVFELELKNTNFNPDILKAIDSVIPYPILFVIKKASLVKLAISYKKPNQKNENIAKVDTIFQTEWNAPIINNLELTGLSTDNIYASFLSQIAGDRLKQGAGSPTTPIINIPTGIERMKEREKIMKQIATLDRQIKSEPSIGKKQALAEQRYRLKQLL